jgi:hypothetical protein
VPSFAIHLRCEQLHEGQYLKNDYDDPTSAKLHSTGKNHRRDIVCIPRKKAGFYSRYEDQKESRWDFAG